MKFNTLLLLPIALIILIIAIPDKHKTGFVSFVSPASLHDSLPPSYVQRIKPAQIQGYKIQQQAGAITYYYEYKADHRQVLNELAALPFSVDSLRADVQCRPITQQSELKHVENLLLNEGIARTFHVDEPLSHYALYQCLKTPQQHFILLHKASDKVIHIIQQA